ncbi:PREDICTED: rho GTPase-activating protein 24-like [Dufourea novaeangliae]|uniref:rho GTPase-activating protein 24-like n=1 Tax=Dufourea novaeangliae TaxID=178035 RepID=UPI0007672E8C|nr:PREDICTED: rho GTPase-activating protein 24-like [Dufourea novaeangliae]
MEDFNDNVDGKLAFRMRKVNSEQFHTLVKMHLSFELDLNTEDNDCINEKAKLKKWGLLSFTKKPKSAINLQKVIEGASLTEDGINQVKQLIEYLSEEQNIIQEGIFRRTGKLTRQQDLKTAMYQGIPLNLNDGHYSVHDCASVLKGFLAELPEPLLSDLHYPAHCQMAELYGSDTNGNDARLLRSLQLLLLLLPYMNRILLKYVLTLLNRTATFECKNKMNCDTLATLFTPHLLCPRKLTPEALHINSQNLSCLVAFMIRKGVELFEIPPKLATDIRAYWVEQERKLLSPKNSDLNESIPDATGTAHTVFSFVDHKLTAKANSTQDTQAALAQLYAHIQAMPESAKKRRLVKQFNKENGQGTPRQVKNCRTKSLGDSIKKHIFQKKILGHKKFIDFNIGCNITRSSSEENILSSNLEKSLLQTKVLFSKSDDELSMETCDANNDGSLLHTKHISNSTGSLNTPTLRSYKDKRKTMLMRFVDIKEEKSDEKHHNWSSNNSITNCDGDSRTNDSICSNMADGSLFIHEERFKMGNSECDSDTTSSILRLSRQLSEPPDIYSSHNTLYKTGESGLVKQNSEPILSTSKSTNVDTISSKCIEDNKKSLEHSKMELHSDSTCVHLSPIVKNRLWNVYVTHTSTPSNLLRKSLVTNDYMLTPITNNDKSMSPITQSATKMTKAMQETMMTPRSRKPVMMVSGSNLCNLATVNNSWNQHNVSNNVRGSNLDMGGPINCISILEESHRPNSTDSEVIYGESIDIEDKENFAKDVAEKHKLFTSIPDDYCAVTQQSTMSITSTFREYLLSRSVLTASPVDLSFTSRTGDFEQSESDLNILNEDGLSESLLCCLNGNNPESDTSGIASGSTNSASNSSERNDDIGSSPRKRATSLQRNDSKRSVKESKTLQSIRGQGFKHKQLSESTLNSVKIKDTFQETSF